MLKQMDPIIDYKNISSEELYPNTVAEPVLVEDPAITQLRTDILAHIESLRLPETNAEALTKRLFALAMPTNARKLHSINGRQLGGT